MSIRDLLTFAMGFSSGVLLAATAVVIAAIIASGCVAAPRADAGTTAPRLTVHGSRFTNHPGDARC